MCTEVKEHTTPFSGATNDPVATNLPDIHPDRLERHSSIAEMAGWFDIERAAVQKRLRPIIEAGLIERTRAAGVWRHGPAGATDAFWGEAPAPVVPDTTAQYLALDALVTY